MSFAKDKIIGDLHRENTSLKTGPTSAAVATGDLRATETALKHTLDQRVNISI